MRKTCLFSQFYPLTQVVHQAGHPHNQWDTSPPRDCTVAVTPAQIFLQENQTLICRSKVTLAHSSLHLGASQDVTPPPAPHPTSPPQKTWMNTCTHTPPNHTISSPFPASPSCPTLWGLLKGAWLHFQLGATWGSTDAATPPHPPGMLAGNEGGARCFSRWMCVYARVQRQRMPTSESWWNEVETQQLSW